MKERLNKLLSVKSIVTLALTIVFCYLAAIEKVETADFLTIFYIIIAFYFGTQAEKKGGGSV